MIARTDRAQASLMGQLKARRVKKTYLALVQGSVGAAVGRIEAPIGRDPRHRTRMAVVPDGRPSVTGYRVRERFDGWTLLELDLVTGRTHQIRVHLDAIGHPVAGDPVYGTGTSRRGPAGLGPAVPARLAARAQCAVGWASDPGDGRRCRPSSRASWRTCASPSVERSPPGPERWREAAAGAMLVIISGPSGVGKDTIIDALRERPREPDYHYVVTCTTRGRRPGEIDGVSYQFLTTEEFHALRDSGGLLEANEVHGHWYGTPRAQVREALAAGHDVILKIDVQGAQQVKERVPNALLIFVVPPSLETLFERLRARATETGRRARTPPAQCRHRAGAPGGLRLRRDQRGRTGRADGRTDRRDHRHRASPPSVPSGPPLGSAGRDPRSRRTRLELVAERLDRSPGRGSRRRRGWPRPDLHLRGPGRTRRPRTRRGRPRRVRTPPGVRHRRRRSRSAAGRGASADRGQGPRRRSVAPTAQPPAWRAGSPPTTSRRRPSSCGRCCRPGCSSASTWSRSGCPATRRHPAPRPTAPPRRRTRPGPTSSNSSTAVLAPFETWPGRMAEPGSCGGSAGSRWMGWSPSNGRSSGRLPGHVTNVGSGWSLSVARPCYLASVRHGRAAGSAAGRRPPGACGQPDRRAPGRRPGRSSRPSGRRRARPARARPGRGPGATTPTPRGATGRQTWRPTGRQRPPAGAGRRGGADPGRDRRAQRPTPRCSTA